MESCAIILQGGVNDKVTWSGTNFSIVQSLSKRYNATYFEYSFHRSCLLRCAIKIYLKLLSIFTHSNHDTYPFWYYRYLSKKIAKQINRSSYDIVFTTRHEAVPFIKHKKIIYITDAIYSLMLDYYYFNVPKRDIKINQLLQDLSIKNAHKIIVSSQWVKDAILSKYQIDGTKIKVVCFGSNIPPCANVKPKTISQPINLLFCGANKGRKRLPLAIELLDFLNKTSHVKYRLDIVGSNGCSSDDIVFHGFLNKNNDLDMRKLEAIYKNAHFLVLPTRAECSSIAFAEAMQYGLPIITCNTGGVPSYIKNNENGFMTDMNDDFVKTAASVLGKLSQDKNQYSKMSANCLMLYKNKYNWDTWGKEVVAFVAEPIAA